ncbi:glycosyltransferase [Aeromicrobium sp. Sec7.5]|uniref:glycosyltransferase n=1 Tax=Aeromicrobium sp. Sec7.5 TaxID=3121276 RepID=UPI002FE4E3FD
MVKVAAVVVTFNRLEKLKTVIARLEAQSLAPAWIVVVDNASTDGTGAWLSGLETTVPLHVVSMTENAGGAGGFARGMSEGYELGADHVWIMDDDCYAEPDALHHLVDGLDAAVRELGPEVPFSCSVVTYTDGSICEMNNPVTTWDWGRLLVRDQRNVMVTACSFVSVLVPRWVIAEHGLPYAEYFIWFDDREYTLRLTDRCPGVQVLDSVVVHDMGDNRGVNFSMVDSANAWKFAHGIRNESSWLLHHQSVVRWVEFGLRIAVNFRRGKVPWRLRLRMFRQYLRGVSFNPPIRYPEPTRAELKPRHVPW